MDNNIIITEIATVGEAKIPSPILEKAKAGSSISLVSDEKRIVVDVDAAELTELINDGQSPLCFELAGPREKIFLCGSTRSGEEKLLLKAYEELLHKIPHLLWIIAPSDYADAYFG